MPSPSIRVLGPGDERTISEFLAPYAESSLFLISNLAEAGIVDCGERFQGTYAGAFDNGALIGVCAHYWNGNQIFQAPPELAVELSSVAAQASGRDIAGLIGPWAQVNALRQAPEHASRSLEMAAREILFALPLGDLIVPAPLDDGHFTCRRATMAEFDLLADWRVAYEIETLGRADDRETRERVTREFPMWIESSRSFVLEQDGRIISFTAFNAMTQDIVQIGGVFTPPEWRGRGYARAAVAGQLQIARAEGATKAILFTQETNAPAQAAYRAIGFKEIGDFGLIHFVR